MIYAEGPSQSIPLAQINSDGTVSVWGSAGRDAQIGLPIGLKYMETVAGILPGANIKSSFANQAGTSAIRNVQAFLSENFYRENQTGFLQWRRSQKVFSKLRVRPLLPNTRARET
jgi:hypothetical protein